PPASRTSTQDLPRNWNLSEPPELVAATRWISGAGFGGSTLAGSGLGASTLLGGSAFTGSTFCGSARGVSAGGGGVTGAGACTATCTGGTTAGLVSATAVGVARWAAAGGELRMKSHQYIAANPRTMATVAIAAART